MFIISWSYTLPIQNFGISKIFFEDFEQLLLDINAYNFKLYANKIKLFNFNNISQY